MAKWTLIALAVVVAIWAVVASTSPADERTPEPARPLSASAPDDAPPGVPPDVLQNAPRVDDPALPAREAGAPEAIPQLAEQPAGNLSVLVLDDLGEPVADVHVRALILEPVIDFFERRTASDGRCLITCPPGRYQVQVNRGPDSNGTHGYAYFGEVDVDREAVDLVAVIARHSAGVRLVARDGLGAPVVGLLVEADAPSRGVDDPEPQRTDGQGEVRWSELTPGRWSFAPASDDPTLNLSQRSTIDVNLVHDTVTTAEWTFERRAQVIVDLRAVPFLSELERLELDSTHQRPPWPAEVSWLVPAGKNTLRPRWSADSASYSAPLEIHVAEGEVRRVALVVETGPVSLAGRVVDTRGVPLEDVLVDASIYTSIADNAAGSLVASKTVTTDASGAWSLRGLPWGPMKIPAYCRDVPGRHLDEGVWICVDTTPEATHIDFGDTTVTPAVRLVCELSESWQAQLRDSEKAKLELLRVEPPPMWPGQTSRKTRASKLPPDVHQFENVVPGEYLLRARDRRNAVFASQTLHVPEGHAEGEPLHVRIGDGEPVFLTTR